MKDEDELSDWQVWRQAVREEKDDRHFRNSAEMEKVCGRMDIQMAEITPYHFRLSRPGLAPLDVFPTSGKVRPLKKGEPFRRAQNFGKAIEKYFAS